MPLPLPLNQLPLPLPPPSAPPVGPVLLAAAAAATCARSSAWHDKERGKLRVDAPHYPSTTPTLSLIHRSGTWNACLFAVAGRGRLATPFGLVCESVAAAAPLDLTPSLDLSKPPSLDLSKLPRLGASASALTPLIAAANMTRGAQGTGARPSSAPCATDAQRRGSVADAVLVDARTHSGRIRCVGVREYRPS